MVYLDWETSVLLLGYPGHEERYNDGFAKRAEGTAKGKSLRLRTKWEALVIFPEAYFRYLSVIVSLCMPRSQGPMKRRL